MIGSRPLLWLGAGAALTVLSACSALSFTPKTGPSFFVTSQGLGKGADLGGLSGADAHCAALAKAAGLPDRQWRAYLSTTGAAPVDARDRIGSGPWVNVKGITIAKNVDQLHGENNISRETALTEKGDMVKNRSDPPLMHDILTGSSPEGRSVPGDKDTTCSNWTSSSTGSAILGHVDRMGTNQPPAAQSWNSSHGSVGCSQADLVKTGGAGLLYCFAAD